MWVKTHPTVFVCFRSVSVVPRGLHGEKCQIRTLPTRHRAALRSHVRPASTAGAIAAIR
jgi:hypothetical protein